MTRNFLHSLASKVFGPKNSRRKAHSASVIPAEFLEERKLLTATSTDVEVAADTAQKSSVDIDGDGEFSFSNDGIILLAYSLGARGEQLEAHRADGHTRSGAEMESAIAAMGTQLDMDRDGEVTFANDGIILLAYSLGARGEQLTHHRNTHAVATGTEIEARIERALPRRVATLDRVGAPSRAADLATAKSETAISRQRTSITGRAPSNAARVLTRNAITNANRIQRSTTSTAAPNTAVREAVANSVRSTSSLTTNRDSAVKNKVTSLRNSTLTSQSNRSNNSISSRIDRYKSDLAAFKSSNRSSNSVSSKIDRYKAELEAFKSSNRSSTTSRLGSYSTSRSLTGLERSLRTTSFYSSDPYHAAPNENVSYSDYERYDNKVRDAAFSRLYS